MFLDQPDNKPEVHQGVSTDQDCTAYSSKLSYPNREWDDRSCYNQYFSICKSKQSGSFCQYFQHINKSNTDIINFSSKDMLTCCDFLK